MCEFDIIKLALLVAMEEEMNIYHIRQILRTKSIYDLNLRVVYYARVSTEKEEQKNSIVNQREHFETFIRSNKNWSFCGGYIDDGISGIHAEKREEFQRMLFDAKAGRFDLIITKEISRFARNTLDSIQYTRQLLSDGVCVWFQNDNINTIDDDSEFRLTIMAGVAQDEIRKLSSRVRFGHAQSIQRGVVLGNSHIYGYDKANGKLTINEEEAVMVRLIFEKYATGIWTTPKIEKLLFDLGYRNYKGGKIDRGVINHIIKNPKYKGYYAGGKVKIVDMFTKKQEFLPPEEWNMYKDDGNTVPAIVDEKTWELANKYFKERSEAIKERRTSFKGDNLFTGKIICGKDHAPYWLKQRKVRGREDSTWVCSHRIKNGANSCPSFGIHEEELKQMLSQIITTSVQNIDTVAQKYLDLLKQVISDMPDNSAELERVCREIEVTQQKADKILEYNLNGAISDLEFLRRNTEYSKRIEELLKRKTELAKKPDTEDDALKRIEGIKDLLKEFQGLKPSDISRQIVEILIDRIEVYPTGGQSAQIKFFLKNDGFVSCSEYMIQKGKNTEKRIETGEILMSCSGHMFKKMIEAQEKQMAGK